MGKNWESRNKNSYLCFEKDVKTTQLKKELSFQQIVLIEAIDRLVKYDPNLTPHK